MTAKGEPTAAYFRRSDPGKQDESIEQQRKVVRRYADDHGLAIVKEYEDGRSGDSDRAEWQAMREAAGSGTFTAVLVWKVDRFSRWIMSDFWREADAFVKADVRLVSTVEGPQDWFTPEGQMLLNFHIFAAHKYLPGHSLNVCRGMADAARCRWWVGKAPFAYRSVPTTPNERRKRCRLVIVDERAEVVRWIFRSYAYGGMTAHAIALELNERGTPTAGAGWKRKPRHAKWQTTTILKILRCEVYRGVVIWNKNASGKYSIITAAGPAPKPRGQKGTRPVPAADQIRHDEPDYRIIDELTWQAAQDRLAGSYRSRAPREDTPFLFTGMVRCGRCGELMHGKTPGQVARGLFRLDERRYVCGGGARKGRTVCRCYRVTEQAVLAALASHADATLTAAADREAVVKLLRGAAGAGPGDADRLRKELARLDANIDLNARRALDAEDDAYAPLMAALAQRRRERTALAEKLKAAEESAATAADADRAADAVVRAAKKLKTTLMIHAGLAQSPEARAVLRRLYESVVVDFEDVVVQNRRACLRNKPDYSGGVLRSRVVGFRINPRPGAFTPQGLAALVSESAPHTSDGCRGRPRRPCSRGGGAR
jgi:DNA invertase Pin-like site-specific DNA recombinase